MVEDGARPAPAPAAGGRRPRSPRAKSQLQDAAAFAADGFGAATHTERGSRTSTSSTSSACTRRTRWTSTTCSRTRCGCSGRAPTCSSTTSSGSRHVLVDEYQDTNLAQDEIVRLSGRGAPQHLRRRRRRPVDLPVPRRGRPQHPRVRGALPRRDGRAPGAELPLHPDHPRRRQRRSSRTTPPRTASTCSPKATRAGGSRGYRADRRARRGRMDRRGDPAARAARTSSTGATSPSSTGPTRQSPRARGRARPRRHPLQGRRRHPLLRPARGEGRASRTCACARTRSTRWRRAASSTCPSAASARRR